VTSNWDASYEQFNIHKPENVAENEGGSICVMDYADDSTLSFFTKSMCALMRAHIKNVKTTYMKSSTANSLQMTVGSTTLTLTDIANNVAVPAISDAAKQYQTYSAYSYSGSSGLTTGAIVGISVGGAVALGLLIGLTIYLTRKKKTKTNK
jgi:hypothetical protein